MNRTLQPHGTIEAGWMPPKKEILGIRLRRIFTRAPEG